MKVKEFRKLLKNLDEVLGMLADTDATALYKINLLATEGLTCDGGHHKQWYLEQILEVTGTPLAEAGRVVRWERGVAP